MAIERHDNGDGTTTFKGVDVTIPSSVANDYDVIAVRSAEKGEVVVSGYLATKVESSRTITPFPVLQLRPTWKPPADLPAGEYLWRDYGLAYEVDNTESWMFPQDTAVMFYRGWSNPPKYGKWQVNEDGTATYLGDS